MAGSCHDPTARCAAVNAASYRPRPLYSTPSIHPAVTTPAPSPRRSTSAVVAEMSPAAMSWSPCHAANNCAAYDGSQTSVPSETAVSSASSKRAAARSPAKICMMIWMVKAMGSMPSAPVSRASWT
jgi:hypothetical protein